MALVLLLPDPSGGMGRGLLLSVLLPVTALLFLGLSVTAAAIKQVGPAIAATAMAVTVILGLGVGTITGDSSADASPVAHGTGTVRSGVNSAQIWSGPVDCLFERGITLGVDVVRGFHVTVTDPEFTAERLPDGSSEVDVSVVAQRFAWVDTQLGVVEIPATLAEMRRDGRTGSAVPKSEGLTGPSAYRDRMEAILSGATVLLEWTCDD